MKIYNLTVQTDQEAFDAVVQHLAAQKEAAMSQFDGRKVCVYQTTDFKRCAVGGILDAGPGDIILQDLQANVDDLIHSVYGVRGVKFETGDVSTGLLLELQHIHDNQFNWGNKHTGLEAIGIEALRRVARSRGLNQAVVDEVFCEN